MVCFVPITQWGLTDKASWVSLPAWGVVPGPLSQGCTGWGTARQIGAQKPVFCVSCMGSGGKAGDEAEC